LIDDRTVPAATWPTVAVAGIAGGLTFLTLESLMLAFSGREPWLIERMIGATLAGEQLLDRSTPAFGAVLLGLALGLYVALVFAFLLVGLIRGTTVGRAYVFGATSGLLIYFAVFHVFSLPFRWLSMAQGVPTALAMALSGVAAIWMYVTRARRMGPPRDASARA
jgi:hypothetical protein